MSIQYWIKQGEAEWYCKSAACFVCIDDFILESVYDNPVKGRKFDDNKPWSIVMDCRPKSYYGKANTIEQRRQVDKIFDDLFGKMTEGMVVSHYGRGGYREKVEFLGHTPFYLVCAAGSIYRMNHDCLGMFNEAYLHYEKFDLRPWTRYMMTMIVGKGVSPSKMWCEPTEDECPGVVCSPVNGHSPVSGSMMNWDSVKRLTEMTPAHLSKLQGFNDEWISRDGLMVSGRDAYFTRWDHNTIGSGSYLLTRLAKKSGFHVTDKPYGPMRTNPYTMRQQQSRVTGIVRFPQFVEEVIVPIDQQKRNDR